MASKQESKKQTAAQDDKQQKHEQDTSSKAVATDKGTAADTQELDSLLEALEGDLVAIEPDAALDLIDEWHGALNKAKEPELKELAGSLKELKQLLKGGKATGHEIGEVLSQIGEQTSEVASEADKGLKTPLQKLGKQLAKAGTSLGKAEDQENIEEIESLSETLDADLTAIEPEAAIDLIDHWHGVLNKSNDDNLKEIAGSLKELKQVLKRKSADASDISEILIRLGEQTTEAGSDAHRGLKGHIQKFGKLLSKAGKSLE